MATNGIPEVVKITCTKMGRTSSQSDDEEVIPDDEFSHLQTERKQTDSSGDQQLEDVQDQNLAIDILVLTELNHLCCQEEDGTKQSKTALQIYLASGHVGTVGAMKKYPNNKTIQVKGCRALQNMVYLNNVYFRDTIVEFGGIETIVAAMQRFPASLRVNKNACGALSNITCNDELSAHRLAIECRGLIVIVDAMRRFPHDARLQNWACITFYNLCDWEKLKVGAINAGAFSAVAAALDNHRENKDVQKRAKNAMRCLL